MKRKPKQVKELAELIDILKRLQEFPANYLAAIERELSEREETGDAMDAERAEDIFTETIHIFDDMARTYAEIRKDASEVVESTFKYWSLT